MVTLKSHSNAQIYSNTLIGTLAVDGWVVIFGTAAAPPNPLLAVPNVTAYSSTASAAITVLLYSGPLICGFNVPMKGLNRRM